ncbi:hypothetical protein EV06_0947 [Prochlorococcus sp. MIT 0602]|nr:hypothetical protein EV06_0947 [Prochlorococcus sp. MIT 0602]KGG17355.1 hypothetical protein EV07_0793 [Prochlorococcus sp. MIT 0603]
MVKILKSICIPLLLSILSLWDLRLEIILLFDNFTFISLLYAIYHHPLAIATLILIPNMTNKYLR